MTVYEVLMEQIVTLKEMADNQYRRESLDRTLVRVDTVIGIAESFLEVEMITKAEQVSLEAMQFVITEEIKRKY